MIMKEFLFSFAFGACTLALSLAFIWACSMLSGCTVYHGTTSKGTATVITTDTTVISHGGVVRLKNIR